MELQGTNMFRKTCLWILQRARWIKSLTITQFSPCFSYFEEIKGGLCDHFAVCVSVSLTLLGNGSVTRAGGNEHTQH
jgi:hypothetical protein